MLYALLKVFVELWILLTAPLVFAFIPKSWDRMPNRFLQLYEDYTYGINGDPYWINPDLSDHPADDAAARSWLWRVKWCYRNANSLDHWFGFDPQTAVRIDFVGDPKTSNRPGHSGDLTITVYDRNGRSYLCRYTVKQWGSSGRCFRFYRGYKLKDLLDFYLSTGGLDPEDMARRKVDIAPRVFSWNPLMGYEK